ncbi:ErfK/YbiS/YcfS/YnhG family protein [hydrothermal vent metagenome]|uniref:ErfK/YbiS/YcfS/YnhG family protein n=1 Tax=hydrothermal vent metagenome TaxID=652676 RepID=A0A3B0XSR4_9ZZZZ
MKYAFFIISALYAVYAMAAPHPEQRLIDVINDIQRADPASAESRLKTLVKEVPDFKLAQLIYADMLISKVQGLNSPAAGLKDGLKKTLFIREIKSRYRSAYDEHIQQKIPSVLVRLDAFYRHTIVIDLNKSRLYLFDNTQGSPVLLKDYFISMGRGGAGKRVEGDLKTPLGVYFVQSYIAPEQLADKYGAGAYPVNYPNAWDRLKGKTGSGIWLHGTRSGIYNRPLLASRGCVVLPNEDLLNVGEYIDLKNTPVLIGESIHWLSVEKWEQQQQRVNQIHLQWKADWESLDVETYLTHYSSRFVSGGKQDLSHWAEHKRRVAKNRTFVELAFSNVSLLMHPQEDVLVATFLQRYASDHFRGQSWKRQYWHKEADGQWRIVFEGKISAPVEDRVPGH